ncbi:MAG: hypothetical protein V7K27_22990 [Nostoc sp.]
MIHRNYFEEHCRSIWRRQIVPSVARGNDDFDIREVRSKVPAERVRSLV